ncbi:phospholipase D family protein [Luteimonas aestuarii]|uniref:Phospholipase D family protein n=1 Tax=Luteimonas aestuarii TaxID=453837 RepID=A0A4R5TML7_9GAMM|nr:phospholipase D family protein [Luteimonas aestuarii]TDK23849.1 phospholipase D family protein [Luteimonas aestuarii]
MTPWQRLLAVALALACSACSGLSALQREQAARVALDARSQQIDCDGPDACARPSPLLELGARANAESAPGAPRHYALLLEYGQDAMLARLDMIRGATRTIDLQTYIFDEDDAGHLFLDELVAAARRGVRVRLLVDQLSALREVDTLAALSATHANFEMRIYNPLLGRARINYPMYALAAACCWRRLNQRMHSKLLLVDGSVAVTGGRNYQDDYYDWNPTFNFRDRDVLVAGPETVEMAANFDAFWDARLSVPVEQLSDVGRRLLRQGAPALPHQPFDDPHRVEAISRNADDADLVRTRLADAAIPVGTVEFIGDLPSKHRSDRERAREAVLASPGLKSLIESARHEVLLQTPYLVLSPPARELFARLQQRDEPPRIIVSTNSLAATDSFITYALSYKYKRRYLRDYGFQMHEYKPFPEDAPFDLDATGAVGISWNTDGTVNIVEPLRDESAAGRSRRNLPLERENAALRYAGVGVNRRVPLQRAGMRVGLHAKSMVVDGRVGVVGTHNFDPRGDNYNTESAVIIEDPVFAQALADSIRRDIAPANAWAIARRDKPPVFSGLAYSMGKLSEHLPVFDFWPTRYATSYEFQPGPDCPEPLPPSDPGFRACYQPVGDFPEVNLGWRSLLTRIFTAFGAGLSPIL